jgi:hypothetical protein
MSISINWLRLGVTMGVTMAGNTLNRPEATEHLVPTK